MTDTDLQHDAIEQVRQRLLQRERELEAVIRVSHALQARTELGELMRQAVLEAMATVGADAGSIILHDAERHKLVFRHVEGPTRDKVMGLEIADTQGIAGEVFHDGVARISHDVSTERSHILDIDRAASYQTRSMITVPLRAGTGENIGVLQVLNKHTGLFDADDQAVVEVLGTQVASAIITAQLFERAKAAAIVDLLGHVSHDIKNLLTPVSMAAQTLQLMVGDFNDEITRHLANPELDHTAVVPAVSEMVQRIVTDMDELFSILNESTQIAQQRTKELADAIKGLTSPPEYHLGDINDVIRSVTRVLHLVAEQHGVCLIEEFGTPPATLHDTHRLYNAVYNLVNNAIGATPDGGCVRVCTGAREDGDFPDGRYVEIVVRDSGCGMPAETAAILFSGHVRSTKPGGTGLGTRVVKNVVDAHAGDLRVESELGHGTTITLRLPIRRA